MRIGKKASWILLLVMAVFCAVALLPSGVHAEELQKVHTIYWKATLKSDVTVKVNGVKTKIKEGSSVVVTNRSYKTNGKSKVNYKGISFKIRNSNLQFITDLCTGKTEGDYNLTTKLWFVNQAHHFTSKTQYMIWVSLDKQRTYVYQGSAGSWQLIRTMKCSTGLWDSPTKPRWNGRIGFKERVYSYSNPTFHATVQYFMEFGGSGFHKWAGGGMSKNIGKHPASHSCIRLSKKNAIWFYKSIPVKTRVVIY